jgi:hypothetical protein
MFWTFSNIFSHHGSDKGAGRIRADKDTELLGIAATKYLRETT